MSTVKQESTNTTEFQPSAWNKLSWGVGYRTSLLGDYFTKLGDRLMGEEPETVADAWERAYARGRSKGVRDMLDIVVKIDAAKA